mgnify:CR=1 FL=1
MDIKTANRLYELRKQHGYSQDELAEMLNVSRQAVSKWERSESSPDTDNLIALARLYGVSLDELLGYTAQASDACDNKDETSDAASDGDKVHIDEDGIYIEDKNGEKVTIKGGIAKFVNKVVGDIHVDGANTTVNGKEAHCDKDAPHVEIADGKIVVSEKDKTARIINDCVWGVSFLLATIAYLLIGFLCNLWHPGWILFFAPFVLGGISSTITHRNASEFPIVFLSLATYLLMGFLANLWHPGWVVFILIPAYYIVVEPIKRAVKSNHKIEVTLSKDDNDIDEEDEN